MPKYLAIDWDSCEARFVYASASARGSQLRILAAERVPLTEDTERPAAETCAAIGGQLRAALDRHSIGRVPTLVCIERTGMELLPLSLPPATDVELPELVANEVLRESAAASEGVFDFFVSGGDSAAARKVVAAVLPAEQRKRIDATAEAARLHVQRAMPRFLAAASLFQRLVPPSDEWHLLVHPGAEEADFVVFQAGQMVYARTARVPANSSDEQRDAWLEGEIHRTLTVAATESGDPHIIEGVYVFGGREEYLGLCERVRQVLLLPAHGLNPLEEYELPPDFAPEHPGRFAGLLGMLNGEAERRLPVIDFLHPHRPARRVGRIKMSAYAVAAVLLLAVVGGGYLWHNLSKAWEVNRQLEAESKRLEGEIRKDAKTRRLVSAINAWEQGNIIWLDELREFSRRLPPVRDALVLRMQLISSGGSRGGGMITFQGLVRDPSLVVRLEYALRDRADVVQSRRIQPGSRSDADYTHLFDASIAVSHRAKKDQVDDSQRR